MTFNAKDCIEAVARRINPAAFAAQPARNVALRRQAEARIDALTAILETLRQLEEPNEEMIATAKIGLLRQPPHAYVALLQEARRQVEEEG